MERERENERARSVEERDERKVYNERKEGERREESERNREGNTDKRERDRQNRDTSRTDKPDLWFVRTESLQDPFQTDPIFHQAFSSCIT